MRKQIFASIAFVAVATVAALNMSLSTKKSEALSLLALANVEALAQNESTVGTKQDYIKGEGWCCGSGKGVCSTSIKC